ncbi:FHA domain-containing protein [Lacunimicrobium album]
MATFIVTTGKLKGHKVQITEPEVYIGRDETCKIRIASKEVSREHCVIMKQGKDVLVRDLSSRNGTFVNGMVINGVTLLNPGDTLHIGPMIFELAGAKKAAVVGHRASAGNIRADRSPSASDHEIADWLSDSGESAIASDEVAGDTHYANNTQQVAVAAAPAVATNRPMTSDIDEATRLVPSVVSSPDDAVASRMADIVRGYWQKKA